MRDYLTLGSTPPEETCAQVGSQDYEKQSRLECKRWKELLEKLFPECSFGIKNFPHDFGTYREVIVYFDEASAQAAFAVEDQMPGTWPAEEPSILKRICEKDHAEALSDDRLAQMVTGEIDCEAADGCIVDPDGSCEHGYRSPLLILGIL